MTINHDIGGGYKYSAKDLTLSQIVAIVNSDFHNRGKATEMADGWRAAAAFAEKIRSELDSSKETLADNFQTPNSEVFFGHVTDVISSAESAVAPAEMNAESLESAVAEVERIKPIIDDLVAEDALYEDNRGEMAAQDSGGGLTEYDVAKADVLAEAQDQFSIADQQFADQRFAMDPPTVFKGPEWHGPDRISDMDGYRNAYYPDGQPATGPELGPNSLPSPTGSTTPTDPSSGGPQLQSPTPVAAPPVVSAPAPTPVTPGAGGPAVPPAGFPPVTANPPNRGGVPVRTAPATPPARPTPSPGPRAGQTPGLPPRSGTSPTQSPTATRGATPPNSPTQRPGGQPPANRSGGQPSSRSTGQPGQRPAGQPSGRTGGQPSRNTSPASQRPNPTTRSNPPTSQARNPLRPSMTPNGPNRGNPPGGSRTATGKSTGTPRGVVKPNAGFEQSISRNLPRSGPGVVGGRENNSVKPVTRPAPDGRVIGARKPVPQHKPGSLTRNGVITNSRKPAATTWSRAQPVRKVDVPRGGVIGRREYFTADTSGKSKEREARRARRRARLAHLTGTATPEQNELMTGIVDQAGPSVIGKRPN